MQGEWLTVAEILELGAPSLPTSHSKLHELIERQGWRRNEALCRVRFGHGGGHEFHVSLLPPDARAKALGARLPTPSEARSNALWAAFERLPQARRDQAQQRLSAVEAVHSFDGGARKEAAVAWVAKEWKVSSGTLWRWLSLVEGAPREDRLPLLASRREGRTKEAPCHPEAWDFLVADYLRSERPTFEACFERMMRAVERNHWAPIPSAKTLKRRIEKNFSEAQRVLARHGADAAKKLYPAQKRDRSIFHAVQAVNADGHKFDVFVKWADGVIGRPVMVAFQDLYSGKILSLRIGRSETWDSVRLAFADLVRDYGVPELCWLDNGRSFASKWLTGRQKTRFRFKIRDEEPEGVLTALGVKVHWTQPYSGQSKPIERAFRDLCDTIARHPAFAGAWTGNNPLNKPENYASKAVAEEDFRRVVASEIVRHNARTGRRGGVCAGRSFDQVFADSISQGALVRRATPAQQRMLLLAAEGVRVRRPAADIELMGTRYWAEELVEHMGRNVVARFDPENLSAPLAVYTQDGRFICAADSVGEVAFNDVEAAREHARRRRDFLRKQRDYLEAEQRLDVGALASLMGEAAAPAPPEPKVAKLVVNARRQPTGWSGDDDFSRGVDMLAEGHRVLPFKPIVSESE